MFNLIASRLNSVSLMVVRIELVCGEVTLGFATAFYDRIDGRKFLVTNWHCVTGREPHNGRCKADDGITPDSIIIWNHHVPIKDGQIQPFETKAFHTADRRKIPIDYGAGTRWRMHPAGQSIDLVIIELNDDEGGVLDCCLSNLIPQRDTQLDIGDDVVIIGFPIGLTPTGTLPLWKSGYVASEPTFPANDESCFWIDAATRPGMSGSPVFKRSRQTTRPARPTSIPLSKLIVEDPGGLLFAGIYSGRIGKADLLEAQLGKVWAPGLIHEIVVGGVDLHYRET